MSAIKQKAISGIIWSSVDNFTTQGIVFIVGIVLARLLGPKEFGLISEITIFIAVSEAFIKSGFSEALIRKKDCTQVDYSTVFFFNLTAGFVFYSVLFIIAPYISSFFKEPVLTSVVRVIGIVLIIDSLTIIQRTTLVKRVDFKLQARISVIASIGSGSLAIILAYKGLGIWSLVALTITRQGLNSLLLWFWNRWRPTLIFSKNSFKELFGFGNKLLISGLIDTVYSNIYYLVIGKSFSATELGFYTRANNFSNFPSHNINTVVGRVTYPVLADMQSYPDILKAGYRRIIKSTMLITFVLMLGLAAVSEPMVITLIGEVWRPSIIYLQLLCFAGMLYPLHSINLNMLKVLGRSDLFLKLEIIKKSLSIPVILIGIFFNIKIMIIGMILNSFVAYYINSFWSGRLIKYSMKDQVRDIAPSFLLAVGMAITIYILGKILNTSSAVTLIIQVTFGGAIAFTFWELLKMPDYLYIKQIVIGKLFIRKQV